MAYVHGVTKEDVFNAASTIFASGKNPTQASVRMVLGKGSFSTISRHLAEWRSEQTDAEALELTTEEMPDQIRSLLNRTYATIRAHAESTVMGERLSVVELENEKLWQENTELKQDLIDLPGLRSAYHESLGRMQDLARENERINKYLPQVDQIESLLAEVSKLGAEKVDLLDKNQELDILKARLEDQLATIQRNLATSIQRANEMQGQLAKLTASNDKLNTQLTQVSDRNQELLEKVDSYEQALSIKLAEIEELKNELKIANSAQPAPSSATTRRPRTSKSKAS